MNAHLNPATLDRISNRTLPDGDLATTLHHLSRCETCARLAGAALEPEIDGVREQLAAADETSHIDPETELAQYVDGTLGAVEREIVETHLEGCAMCRAEVDDLLALAKPRGRRWPVLLAVAAVAAAVVVTITLIQRRTVVTPPHPIEPAPVVATATTEPVPETLVHRYANAEWDRLVREALRSGRLPVTEVVALSGVPDALRGSSDRSTAVLRPTGVVVESVQPRFSWPARQSTTYVVTIFDGDEAIAQSEPLKAAYWTPPAPLRRGRTYVWQVAVASGSSTAILPAPPAPPAMFRIASQRDHDDLAAARRLHPDDHLLHAVLAARAGLRAEAKEALRRANVRIDLP